jgi:ubiquinone/menaquinone biosynthesis C-methylase UbiE
MKPGERGLVSGRMESERQYVLGNDAEELDRLDRQAGMIERPTQLILQAAGLKPGMRVLDLGSGLGHVARLAGELVGQAGSVLGIDRSEGVLAAARDRTQRAGMPHVEFASGDATTWRMSEPVDAVVGRLLLFHVADPAAVMRHHIANLRAGGAFVAIDFDLGGSRCDPPVPFVEEVVRWVEAAFQAAGAWPRVGARLGVLLEEANFERVTTFGIQRYISPRDHDGPALLAGVARSLAPAIVGHGIATAEALGIATLETRIEEALRHAHAVMIPPTVVGAWGYLPDVR